MARGGPRPAGPPRRRLTGRRRCAAGARAWGPRARGRPRPRWACARGPDPQHGPRGAAWRARRRWRRGPGRCRAPTSCPAPCSLAPRPRADEPHAGRSSWVPSHGVLIYFHCHTHRSTRGAEARAHRCATRVGGTARHGVRAGRPKLILSPRFHRGSFGSYGRTKITQTSQRDSAV